MGSVCPGSRRVTPVDDLPGSRATHFQGVHEVPLSPVLDSAVQTEFAWTSESAAKNYLVDETRETDEAYSAHPLEHQLGIANLTLGVFFDGTNSDCKLFLKYDLDLLRKIFKQSVHVFDFKEENEQTSQDGRLDACDCFLVVVGGKIDTQVGGMVPNGHSDKEAKTEKEESHNPFHGKPVSIACTEPEVAASVGPLRLALSSMGGVILPTILVFSENEVADQAPITIPKAILELKFYASAIKLRRTLHPEQTKSQ